MTDYHSGGHADWRQRDRWKSQVTWLGKTASPGANCQQIVYLWQTKNLFFIHRLDRKQVFVWKPLFKLFHWCSWCSGSKAAVYRSAKSSASLLGNLSWHAALKALHRALRFLWLPSSSDLRAAQERTRFLAELNDTVFLPFELPPLWCRHFLSIFIMHLSFQKKKYSFTINL